MMKRTPLIIALTFVGAHVPLPALGQSGSSLCQQPASSLTTAQLRLVLTGICQQPLRGARARPGASPGTTTDPVVSVVGGAFAINTGANGTNLGVGTTATSGNQGGFNVGFGSNAASNNQAGVNADIGGNGTGAGSSNSGGANAGFGGSGGLGVSVDSGGIGVDLGR